MSDQDRHLPQAAPVESYGDGGFRFAGMSHRGSILCLPGGIWAWPVADVSDLTEETLARVFASPIALFVLGAGKTSWTMPEDLRWHFRAKQIAVEIAQTRHAIMTYNILLDEGRRVGAGLIAV
ncbi:MAG: Mth938-like domain-containing protein [Pseudorhodoplanes sp.]